MAAQEAQRIAAAQAAQQPGSDNATIKNLLNHPPLNPAGPRVSNPGAMSALSAQLSRPPNPVQSGNVMMNNPQQMGGMQPGMQQQQRAREVIWDGELHWRENTKSEPGQEKTMHTVRCGVTTSKENGIPEVKSDNWPKKLIMQLIPKNLVQTIGGHYFRNSR